MRMERLIKLSQRRVKAVDTGFHRYLYTSIQWEQPLSIIKGARGAGKTTLMLQRMKSLKEPAIYLSLDDFYFESNRLLLLIEALYEKGYRHFFLDEVHQYPHWSKDLKNLYDSFPDISIVATSSSILQIDEGQSDLSRRAGLYFLQGLSFREFLEMEFQRKYEVFSLKEILDHHIELTPQINDQVDILSAFQYYLKYGYYPFFQKDKLLYHQKLQQIIHLIIEKDIPAVENISYTTIKHMRKLLFVISQSVPFTPNIQSLSDKIGIPRSSILKALDMLSRGSVIHLLQTNHTGVSLLQKPKKIYLQNSNISYALSGNQPNRGNLRETFFFNQLQAAHQVTYSKFSDFMVDYRYTFEVGGADKTKKQIHGLPQSYVAADEMKNGPVEYKIPLWLFGFLY